jgi:hypothetical protein
LTLIVVPILFTLVYRIKLRLHRNQKRREQKKKEQLDMAA